MIENKAPALQPKKLTFSQVINTPKWRKLIHSTIQNPDRRDQFITSIVAAVANNPALQECTPASVISGALQGAALNLSPSPQMGQFYLIPFECALKDPKSGKTLYQRDENGQILKDRNGHWLKVTEKRVNFVPGYKGYIQLALRSGEYQELDARPVVEGEYLGRDPFTGRPRFKWIEDDAEREQRSVVGYFAFFELLNGFRKVLYWSREQMITHADKYSAAFHRNAVKGQYPSQDRVSFEDYLAGNYPKDEEWKYSSFWYKNFNVMAEKTMLKQLITKWGLMSVDMEKAVALDDRNTRIIESSDQENQENPVTDAAFEPLPDAFALASGYGDEDEPDDEKSNESEENALIIDAETRETPNESPRENPENTPEIPPENTREQSGHEDSDQSGQIQIRMGFNDL